MSAYILKHSRKIPNVEARMIRDNEITVHIYDMDGKELGTAIERTGRVFGGLHEVFVQGTSPYRGDAPLTRAASNLRDAARRLLDARTASL